MAVAEGDGPQAKDCHRPGVDPQTMGVEQSSYAVGVFCGPPGHTRPDPHPNLDFDGFFVDFWLIFDGLLVDVGSMFDDFL